MKHAILIMAKFDFDFDFLRSRFHRPYFQIFQVSTSIADILVSIADVLSQVYVFWFAFYSFTKAPDVDNTLAAEQVLFVHK